MCVSIPGKVVAIDGGEAVLDVLGARRRAGLAAMADQQVAIGDYVLTSAGLVVAILDADDAAARIALFQELMDLVDAADAMDLPFDAADEANP